MLLLHQVVDSSSSSALHSAFHSSTCAAAAPPGRGRVGAADDHLRIDPAPRGAAARGLHQGFTTSVVPNQRTN